MKRKCGSALIELECVILEKPFTVEQFNQELLIHFGPGTVPQTAQRLTREFELKWRFGARRLL